MLPKNQRKSEEIFNTHKAPYEEALKSSGYRYNATKDKNVNLKYKKPGAKKRKRKPRKVLYFNPPFSRSVETNVIKLFLSLIDKHFHKGHN